jgi:hypothetical protein
LFPFWDSVELESSGSYKEMPDYAKGRIDGKTAEDELFKLARIYKSAG